MNLRLKMKANTASLLEKQTLENKREWQFALVLFLNVFLINMLSVNQIIYAI